MPSDSFRLRVMKAITDQLKTITPANGYMHDMSDFVDEAGRTMPRVSRGRLQFGISDPMPLIAVLEDPRPVESGNAKGGSPLAVNKWRILVQGFVEDDKMNPLDPAYHLSADAISALVQSKADQFNILGMGGKITDMKIEAPSHRPGADEVSTNAYFIFGVTLAIVEDLERPRGE